jgi:hypothetical protein
MFWRPPTSTAVSEGSLKGRTFVLKNKRSAERSRHPSALAPHSALRNSAQMRSTRGAGETNYVSTK